MGITNDTKASSHSRFGGKEDCSQPFRETGWYMESKGPSPNQYGPPVWKKSQIGYAESETDVKIREQVNNTSVLSIKKSNEDSGLKGLAKLDSYCSDKFILMLF